MPAVMNPQRIISISATIQSFFCLFQLLVLVLWYISCLVQFQSFQQQQLFGKRTALYAQQQTADRHSEIVAGEHSGAFSS